MKDYLIMFSRVSVRNKAICLFCMLFLSQYAMYAGNGNKEPENADIEVTYEITEVSEAMLAAPEWISTKANMSMDKTATTKRVILKVTYKNNNKNGKVIQSIFDKTVRIIGTFTWGYNLTGRAVDYTMKSAKVSKVEIYPGQSHSISYMFDAQKCGKFTPSEWSYVYENKLYFKMDKWSHNFQVKTD